MCQHDHARILRGSICSVFKHDPPFKFWQNKPTSYPSSEQLAKWQCRPLAIMDHLRAQGRTSAKRAQPNWPDHGVPRWSMSLRVHGCVQIVRLKDEQHHCVGCLARLCSLCCTLHRYSRRFKFEIMLVLNPLPWFSLLSLTMQQPSQPGVPAAEGATATAVGRWVTRGPGTSPEASLLPG